MNRFVQLRPASSGSPSAAGKRVPRLRGSAPARVGRKLSQSSLGESKVAYRAIAEAAQDYIYIIGRTGCVEYLNPFAARVFGLPPGRVVGQPLSALFPPEIAARQQQGIQRVLDTGEPLHVEAIVPFPGGDAWLSTTLTPLRDKRGPVRAVLGISRDVTERKQAEETQATLAAIAENSNDAIIGRGSDGKIIFWNAAAERMLGYTAAEIIGSDLTAMFPPELLHENLANRDLLRAGKSLSRQETVRIAKDGRRVHIERTASPIKDASGRITGFATILRDITERKRAEEKLRENEERFRVLAESIPHHVWSARADGASDYYNQRFLNYLGKTHEEMQGWTWASTLHPDDQQRSIAAWTEAVGSGVEYRIEYRIRRAADGEYRWHLGHAVPLRNAAGNVVRWFGTCTDIHDRKQAEQALRELSYRLLELEENERRSINRELHDRIGQTLSALNLDLQIVRVQLSAESRRKVGNRIDDAQRLLEMTMAQVRNVMANLRPPALDDYGLLGALRAYLDLNSVWLSIPVKITTNGDLPRLPSITETALFRIAQEALSNVAKHAHAQRAEIVLAAAQGRVTLTVADDGAGFDAQCRAERATWGLVTMRERAQAVGAALRIDSAPGNGTRVTVQVPLSAPPPRSLWKEALTWNLGAAHDDTCPAR